MGMCLRKFIKYVYSNNHAVHSQVILLGDT
jgi:hypothetical protein